MFKWEMQWFRGPAYGGNARSLRGVQILCSAEVICVQKIAGINTIVVGSIALHGNWEMPLVRSNPRSSWACNARKPLPTLRDE